MRIKFLSFNYSSPFSFNPVYYWLKSFYAKNGKHFSKYEWLPTVHVYSEDIVDKILEEEIDILCISVYVWSIQSTMEIVSKIKEKNPNIIVICGGPECDVYTNFNWMKQYPFVDYAVYGDGEEAFAGLLDYFYDQTEFDKIPNVVSRAQRNNHRIFKFSDYKPYSPYLDLADEFLEDYFTLKKSINDKPVYLPYELARGCMYKCSFCDWHGGIHHKVNRRNFDYRKEVDFFADNNIRAFQTDANVGIYQEDIDFYEYVATKYKPGSPIPVEPRNMAKLNKDNVAKIWNILCSLNGAKPNFPIKSAVQTIYDDVLEKIDRPDIPWDQHKKMLMGFKETYSHTNIFIELILGLPGMSFKKIHDMYIELSEVKVNSIYCYEWMLLNKSPAASLDYRNKNNLQTTKTYYPALFGPWEHLEISENEFYNNPDSLIKKNQVYFFDMIYDKEVGIKAVIYQKLLTSLYNNLRYQDNFTSQLFIDKLNKYNQYLLDVSEIEAEKQMQHLSDYGFYFWADIDKNNNLIRSYEFALDRYIKNE